MSRRQDREFFEIMGRSFSDSMNVMMGKPYTPPPLVPDPWYKVVGATIGGALLAALGLAVLASILYVFAIVARLGWEAGS